MQQCYICGTLKNSDNVNYQTSTSGSFPTDPESSSGTSLPHIVNAHFACSVQHFVFREPNPGHRLTHTAFSLDYTRERDTHRQTLST
ncbi:hypothetical protein JOB18_036413 [Solea senegalensis]|uniref:Uncharacterized protein n=1 Tax=Solea senegalensis TaxID=28829 RepID=A0AAV6QF79_SOLSE|nr:hypothetical protein JOB18_036413 [Solea senegalensis]